MLRQALVERFLGAVVVFHNMERVQALDDVASRSIMLIIASLLGEYYSFFLEVAPDGRQYIDTQNGAQLGAIVVATVVQSRAGQISVTLNATDGAGGRHTPNEDQAYMMGYAEGYVLAEQVRNSISNAVLDMFPKTRVISERAVKYIQKQLAHIDEQTADPMSAYWTGVALSMQQLRGVVDGCNAREHNRTENITLVDLFFLNSRRHIHALDMFAHKQPESDWKRSSGVVVTDFQDIYIGYAAADSYYLAFDRVSKQYVSRMRFHYSTDQKIQFIAPAGVLWPMDGVLNALNGLNETECHYAVVSSEYVNHNTSLYGPVGEAPFRDGGAQDDVPSWLGTAAAARACDFNQYQNTYLKHQTLATVAGSLFVDYDKFERVRQACVAQSSGDTCESAVFRRLVQNQHVLHLLEHNMSIDVTQEFFAKQYALVLNSPRNANLSRLLNTPSDAFNSVNASIRERIICYNISKLLEDPLNTLEAILVTNTGKYGDTNDFREGFAPRYDLQSSDVQYGSVGCQITSQSLQKSMMYWFYNRVPDSAKPFTVQQLPDGGHIRGSTDQPDIWANIYGCGNKNFGPRCDACNGSYDIVSLCTGCIPNHVEYKQQCLNKFSPELPLNKVINYSMLSVALLILFTIVVMLLWVMCFMQGKRVFAIADAGDDARLLLSQ